MRMRSTKRAIGRAADDDSDCDMVDDLLYRLLINDLSNIVKLNIESR
jgi:hypothetical protein